MVAIPKQFITTVTLVALVVTPVVLTAVNRELAPQPMLVYQISIPSDIPQTVGVKNIYANELEQWNGDDWYRVLYSHAWGRCLKRFLDSPVNAPPESYNEWQQKDVPLEESDFFDDWGYSLPGEVGDRAQKEGYIACRKSLLVLIEKHGMQNVKENLHVQYPAEEGWWGILWY